MLAKENRLKKQKEFDGVFKKGRGLRSDSLFLKFVKNETGKTKIAFVVSKKVSNKAVDRNKIKRRLREAVREVGFNQGFDIIIIAQPQALEKDFKGIREEIKSLFKKI